MASELTTEMSRKTSFFSKVIRKFFAHEPNISTLLVLSNSHLLISFDSSLLNNPRMKTSKEIRHENLLLLISRYKTIQALADRLGKSHAQVSQLKNKSANTSTGKTRGIGDEQAREIELKLGLEHGWMDHEHDPNEEFSTELPGSLSESERTYYELKVHPIQSGKTNSILKNLYNLLKDKDPEELEKIKGLIDYLDSMQGKTRT